MFVDTRLAEAGRTLVDTTTHSLYIPILPAVLNNTNVLMQLFDRHLHIGVVRRVDFVKRPNEENKYMAFIHFQKIYCNTQAFNIFNMLSEVKNIDIMGTVDTFGNTHVLAETLHYIYMSNHWGHLLGEQRIPDRTFIRIRLNTKPIKDTVLNIHQIATNLENTESIVETLTNKNTELEKTVQLQSEMLTALEDKIKEMDKAISRMKWAKSTTSKIVTNLTNRIYSIENQIEEIDNDLSDTMSKIYYM
jgi:hypothetical protein